MKKLKLFIIVLFCLFVNITIAKADVQTFDRLEVENYGVNKKWNITSRNKENVLSTDFVDASEKIYDYSNVLDEEEYSVLKENIDGFIKKTGFDLVIVIKDLSYYSDSQNEDFAADFYDYNDFGINDKYYSGIVLFRNTYSVDPYYDIYTFGSAQLYFDDNRYNKVLDDIYDDLHQSNYLRGFTKFIDIIDGFYDKGIPLKNKRAYIDGEHNDIKYKFSPPYLLATIISLIISAVILSILIKKNKMIKLANKANDYLDKTSINYTRRENTFINSTTTHYTVSSSSGGGGGHSSFGSSGGGHSSGGGRHG